MIDPLKLPQLAERRAKENYKFREYLKRHCALSSEEVDRLVFAISERVWKKIDCTACGNCCRVVSPALDEEDAERLARHVGLARPEFESQYLKPAESPSGSPWIMRDRPCPFLRDNRCSVYEHRPGTCRGYPYLDRPNFTARTLAMIDRLSECPAVFDVWEELKDATGFWDWNQYLPQSV